MDLHGILQNFFQKYPSYHYRKRENILFGGDTPSGIFYVASGYVRSFISNAEGKEFTRRIYRPSDFFPFRTILNNIASVYSYQALTDTQIKKAPREDFINFVKDDYKLLYKITNDLLERVDETLKRLEVTVMGTAHERVVVTLSFIANGLGQIDKNRIIIGVPFTHQEIATMAGLTRETVTIEIEKLNKEGIIQQKDKTLIIPDVTKLEGLISQYK